MSNVSLENLVILTQDPIGQNDGISNTAFETNEDENSDLEIGFLENLNFEDSAEETSKDDRFADVKTGNKDKPLVKEDNKESTLVCERQPAESKGNVIPENLTPAKSEDNQTLEQVKEQNQTNGKCLNKIKDTPVLSRNSSNAVVQRKQPLKGSADGIAISTDYVWGPLFQELPYKTVTFNPHHAIRPDPYTQGIVRNRKPQVLVDRQKQGPIKRYNSNASQSEEDESKWHHVTRDIIQAIFVRLLLVCHSFLCVWRAVDVKKDELYWCLALTNVVLVIETIYTIVKRQGRDPKWICPCFVIYLGGTVPALWFLQIDKLDRYNEAMSGNVSNLTDSLQEALSSIEGVQIPIYLDPDTWVAILEQILLFVLVVGRMLLPLGALSREELSQLLFIFIGSGSDVMELFVVFDEPQFRTNSPLKFATLTVWSVSLLQFTFVLTAAKSPKKIRLGTTEDKYHSVKEKRATFGIEILSLLISFLLMDGPYCALRLYAIIVYKVVSYGIIFFTCKNILMLVLLLYRLFIICIKFRNRGREKKEALREIAHRKHAHRHNV